MGKKKFMFNHDVYHDSNLCRVERCAPSAEKLFY